MISVPFFKVWLKMALWDMVFFLSHEIPFSLTRIGFPRLYGRKRVRKSLKKSSLKNGDRIIICPVSI